MLKPKGHQRCHGRFLDDATFLPLVEQPVKPDISLHPRNRDHQPQPEPVNLRPAINTAKRAERSAYSAFRAPCPARNIPARSPAVTMGTRRGVTAAAPTTPHAHDSVAGGRKWTAIPVFTIGVARCSCRASRNSCAPPAPPRSAHPEPGTAARDPTASHSLPGSSAPDGGLGGQILTGGRGAVDGLIRAF
jgi:hypothetical protein